MADKKNPGKKRRDDESSADGAPTQGAPGAGDQTSGSSASADAAASATEAAESTAAQAEADSAASADGIEEDELTVQDILDAAEREAAEPSSEHLADLKRVTAEYANYRRRTEANREVEKERVTGDIVKLLIPILDDLYRAEKHGDLEGDTAFATIAGKLRSSVERLGLTSFGTVGDPFDPTMHEAIFQQPSADVDTETVGDVAETGYYLGSTLLRAAKVVVQVPSDG
ncbi:nucleotide exchange factor GrpE [Cryobacterium psychrophilum]|uniref:Protein GrpE n=1 Tax=Cryobacterium psychrophilum TaxID=41988 RepID=A0A4Y8KV75_9MICO|nr:nucleotide exchange factor GrpE [Cryobacterium psychrophilum]TDW30127.1 molecular chaperone GrpE [Cryobacterium psychrophilum]TFD79893.1 nucleotide exchange factor GrpE [Cryobacterium psychrophilum]